MRAFSRSRPAAALASALLSLTLLGAGCAAPDSSAGPPSDDAPAADAGTWPRTITQVDGEDVVLEAAPERIVALSSDIADVALQLVPAEHLAAVPDITQDPHQSLQHENAQEVTGTVHTGAETEAESVLAFEPDLVLITTRHDAETQALDQLADGGIPVIAVDNTWDTPEVYADNVRLVGHALGAEAEAEELIGEYERRWQAIEAAVADIDEQNRPRTALLRIIAGQIYYSGPGAISQAVLTAAGARSTAEESGMERSQPASVEQLSADAPDRIVLLDSTGAGETQFGELLDSPGTGAVPAIAEDRILLLSAAELSSGSGGIEALERIAGWLHPDAIG